METPEMEKPSRTAASPAGIVSSGFPARLEAIGTPPASKNVNSRNSGKSST